MPTPIMHHRKSPSHAASPDLRVSWGTCDLHRLNSYACSNASSRSQRSQNVVKANKSPLLAGVVEENFKRHIGSRSTSTIGFGGGSRGSSSPAVTHNSDKRSDDLHSKNNSAVQTNNNYMKNIRKWPKKKEIIYIL